jgi:hypothetical protein
LSVGSLLSLPFNRERKTMRKIKLSKVQQALLKLHGAKTLLTDCIFNVVVLEKAAYVYRIKGSKYNLEKKILTA